MGCDIHLYTEIKMYNKIYGDRWISADYWMENRWRSDADEPPVSHKAVYGIRNYHLFGMLADVRNHDHSPVMPHDEGVPEDCSNLYRKEAELYGTDGHSHGYVTYDKLLEFFNSLTDVKVSGMVHVDQATEYRATGKQPTNWCASTTRDNYVETEWTAPASVFTGAFLVRLENHYVEVLEEVYCLYEYHRGYERAYDEHKKDFRILFFFDN